MVSQSKTKGNTKFKTISSTDHHRECETAGK